MLSRLREKLNRKKVEKFINKPRFTIEDLYVADIVLLKNQYSQNGRTRSFYIDVKKSVIVENVDSIRYSHIKSKQVIKEMYWGDINDYALNNLTKFKDKFAIYMRKHNLKENSLLSIKQVLQLEDALQTGLIDDLITSDELFK